jgi:DNA helicase-2/ATP-dependent DNA helicase PcrA
MKIKENPLFSINYEKELNPSQLEAVTTAEGPLLIIAGAGSGKTRTLTYRVAHLVEKGISPHTILLLTFTRKASQEMIQRASILLDSRCINVPGGTFHSFANLVLQKYVDRIGFKKGFSILDRSDSESLINILRKEKGVSSKNRSFPRKQTLLNIFSSAVNKSLTIKDVVMDNYAHFATELDTIENLFSAYKCHKARHNFFDYDDLLTYLHILLRDDSEVRKTVSANYRYLMVDEYQDTNKIQAEIVYLLACEHKNVMVVGDDSQSIYAFRGANFKNIMIFPTMFPDTKIIKLEENYRSTQPILNLTNSIMDHAVLKYTKRLFTKKPGSMKPVLVCTESEYAQSRFVVERIKKIHEDMTPLNEIAVLFRAGFHSFGLEIELVKEGIPFIKVGGFKFLESAHIKDVLAHLRVICNPYDKISWYRILLLLDKIGPKTAQNLYEQLAEKKIGYSGLFTLKVNSVVSQRMKRLKELYESVNPATHTPAQIGNIIVNYYAPILEKNYDDHPKRSKDLEHLVTIMERYNNIEAFLTDMALEPPNTSTNGSFSSDYSDNTKLVLSTVHSAKGLEWKTVFVIWALDGRFPSIRAMQNSDDLEEERRLMYVAATRAKERLFFTYPINVYDRSSNMLLYSPSCFIDTVPENIIEKQIMKNRS